VTVTEQVAVPVPPVVVPVYVVVVVGPRTILPLAEPLVIVVPVSSLMVTPVAPPEEFHLIVVVSPWLMDVGDVPDKSQLGLPAVP